MSSVVPVLLHVETYDVDESGDLIVHNPVDGRMLVLNPVGAATLTLIDGERDCDTIVSEIASVFAHVPRASIEQDVRTFLDELERWGLVTLRASA